MLVAKFVTKTVALGAVLMNKVRETSTNQLDMGSLTQIKSFDEEIKKLGELLVKLNPITEQLRNRIASLRNDASYYNGMLNSDTKAFQQWFNQSNYKQNLNNIKTMIKKAQELLDDKDVDDSDCDFNWTDPCGEAPNCYYNASCNQTCSYTPDCNETEQGTYVIGDDGGVDCTFVGESCTETCGECGEIGITTPDPVSECSLPGCDDAACMEQIACGQLCTEVIDCDQTVCDVCIYGTSTGVVPPYDIIDCSNGVCDYAGSIFVTIIWDDCTFTCNFPATGEVTIGKDCSFSCSYGSSSHSGEVRCTFSCEYYGEIGPDCSYTYTEGAYGGGSKPCDQQVLCNQTTTCSLPCGLTVCDDSAGCGQTCEHSAEDCGDCFYGGCEAGDGDCGDCSDCGDCGDCSNGACSHDCSDGTDTCGEPCGDSCGLI